MLKRLLGYVLVCASLASLGSCGGKSQESSAMTRVITIGEVTTAIDSSKDSLIAFDMYADWCGPCKVLAPTLEKVAIAAKGKVTFFRVNMDQVPEAAQLFGVRGIPFIVFIKNKQVVASYTGVQPEEAYLGAIRQFSGSSSSVDRLGVGKS
jgi:thioredoxin 1